MVSVGTVYGNRGIVMNSTALNQSPLNTAYSTVLTEIMEVLHSAGSTEKTSRKVLAELKTSTS